MSLRNALAHLTAVRIPPRTRIPLPHSVHYFPWMAAGLGSLNILCFLAVSQFLPAPAACLVAVVFPQILAGFSPWRGVMEAAQGIRTLPGHGFLPGFRPDTRGIGAVAVILLAKWTPLTMLPPDGQVRAVFIFPILGLCARTFAHLLDQSSRNAQAPHAARRRVRAGFLSGVLLFLAFLFPLRTAVALLLAGGLTGAATLWLRGRRGRALTLQTAVLVSELVEVAVLAGLALSGLFLFRL